MDETFQTKAIVLKRQPFREADLKAVFFSADYGRIDLVARGAKKPGSKLAGFLEPLNSVKLMVVRGRHYNYVGGIDYEDVFVLNVLGDLDKAKWIQKGFGDFNRAVSLEERVDAQRLYSLLHDFLKTARHDFLYGFEYVHASFVFKLLSVLGYAINDVCPECGKVLKSAVLAPKLDNAWRCPECLKAYEYAFFMNEAEWNLIKTLVYDSYLNLINLENLKSKSLSRLIDYYASYMGGAF